MTWQHNKIGLLTCHTQNQQHLQYAYSMFTHNMAVTKLINITQHQFFEREVERGRKKKAHIQSPNELNYSSFYYEAKQDVEQLIHEYLLGKLLSTVTIYLLCTVSYKCI